jgi:hypothetical protein
LRETDSKEENIIKIKKVKKKFAILKKNNTMWKLSVEAFANGLLAQQVEQLPFKEKVLGSNPG